jgi:serine protease Do
MKYLPRPLVALGLALVVGLTTTPSFAVDRSAAAAVPSPAGSGTFAKLAEAVKPAVINVSVEKKAGGSGRLEEFLGRRGAPGDRTRRGVGSGVIVDPSGLALTNAHVVDGATRVEVVTVAGDKYQAKVVGADKKTDLAVLRIENATADAKFPFLPLGDSDAVQVGDWVIAVGSPFGLQATVTSGIVSAKARHIGAGPYDDFLQTDAAINPGNSGGPLVNMRGEVVGINTAIVSGGSGIGFAIPSNMAKQISAQLVATGSVTRGWLGVSLQPLTSDLAASFGVEGGKGALVAEVQPQSPAAKAGVRSGDVIIEVNGKKVESASDVVRTVGFAKPGDETRLTVWRDRSRHTLTAKLGEQPGETAASRLGLDVRPVTPAVAQELGLPGTDGVVVMSVEPDSAGARAGIERGDILRELDGKPIKSLADFERVTSGLATDKPVSARLQRGSNSMYVALPPAKQG